MMTMTTLEALAHYVRGAATLFFLMWCFKLHRYIRRKRMMRVLFTGTVGLVVCYSLDMVFLVEEWKNLKVLNDLIVVIDLLCVPLSCSFFLEVTRPGFSTPGRMAMAVGVQSVFILLFLCWPTETTVIAAYSMAYSMAAVTIVGVLVFAHRYRRFISENYSYNENLDVTWVIVSSIVYFLSLFFFVIAFDQTTWLSEILYNLFVTLMWTFLFIYARRHRVVRQVSSVFSARPFASDVGEEVLEVEVSNQPAEGEEELDQVKLEEWESQLAQRLERCMNEEKYYLNPRISLYDVALAVGTNKTYLSDYLNRCVGQTFYDYVNGFRIQEACRYMENMPASDGRKTVAEVAQLSGFNSLSTFNRYFYKLKGMTPKEYMNQQ